MFLATLGGAGVTSANDIGFYRFGNAGTVQIAREGDAAPAGPGTSFTFLYSPALNDAGQAAFLAFLSGTGVTPANNEVLYRLGDADTVQIVGTGDAPPAGPGNFRTFDPSIALNDAGQAAFFAGLGVPGSIPPTTSAFTASATPAPSRSPAAGDAVPAGPGNFTSFVTAPALNEAGQAAFLADLGGFGVDSTNDCGIYLYDDILGLLTIAREGDPFLGSTITGLIFNNGRADEYNGFNNLGQVAYWFQLANGNSGIALFTIPEPTNAARRWPSVD